MLVFGEANSLEGALAVLIPFASSSIGVIGFLMITESVYRKARLIKEAEKHIEWDKTSRLLQMTEHSEY